MQCMPRKIPVKIVFVVDGEKKLITSIDNLRQGMTPFGLVSNTICSQCWKRYDRELMIRCPRCAAPASIDIDELKAKLNDEKNSVFKSFNQGFFKVTQMIEVKGRKYGLQEVLKAINRRKARNDLIAELID